MSTVSVTTKLTRVVCPKCKKTVLFLKEGDNLNKGITTDCPKCGKKVTIRHPTKADPEDVTKATPKDKDSTKNNIKEIKCVCNQCKHVWHYLEKDEKDLKKQAAANTLVGCGMCCNPFGALFLNKSNELQRQAEKLSKCPKCGSGDIKKTEIYYDKKT